MLLIEERRKRDALRRRNRVAKQRERILEILGNKCSNCPFDDKRALAVDHILGGGTKERNKIGGGYYTYVLKKLSTGNNEYQLLCCNCNQIKKVERDEERMRKY